MSTARLLPPSVNLIDEVVEVILSGTKGNDLSNSIIVFPGKRPAHVVRKKLAGKIGKSFLPPKIFSIDIFIDFFYREQLQQHGSDLSSLDAVAILHSLHRQLPEEHRLSSKHFTTLDSFYPLGLKLFNELEELYIGSVSSQKLDQSLAAVSLESSKTLAALYKSFYEETVRRGIATRSMKYRYVAEHIREADCSRFQAILFAGFYALTSTESEIVRYLLGMDNVTMVFQNGAGIHAHLQSLGLDLTAESDETIVEDHFYQSPDTHGELFALNTVLSKNLPEMVAESEDSVIVLPSSENLFPLFHQTLAGYDQSAYNIALGYPLSRTPVYGFLTALMEVLVSSRNGEIFVPAYLKFLLHPYTKNIMLGTRNDVTRILIHAIEELCTAHRTRIFISLNEVERSTDLAVILEKRLKNEEIRLTVDEVIHHLKAIHASTLQTFLTVRSIGDLGTACIDILSFINEQSTAHRHPFFRPFVESLMEHLQLLTTSLLSDQRFEKFDHLFAFFRQYVAEADVPFTGTPLQGLQVLGFLETRGLKFKNVYVLDMNDDVIPGGVQQDVLLPLKIRQQLGLSTYKEQEQIKAYIFDVLRKGAEKIHYFFVENETKTKSRFVEQLLWKKQQQAKSLSAGDIEQLHYSIDLSTTRPEPVVKSPAVIDRIKELAFSATMLDTYIGCQLQFYYRYILRLYEKEDISGDVEHTDVGKLIHTILEEYFRPLTGKKLTPKDIDLQRLVTIVDDVFTTYYGDDLLGEQLFTKRQILKHLSDYFTDIQLKSLEESETSVQFLETDLAVHVEDWSFKGRADRIETRDGKVHILDYKTGSNEKNVTISFRRLNENDRSTWKGSIGSVQLPLYAMMYSKIEKVPAEDIVPKIVFLGKRVLDDKTEFGLFETKEEAEEWYPKLEKIILSLVKEIADPSKSFEPTDDIENDCPSCPFKVICGTQWAEKYSVY